MHIPDKATLERLGHELLVTLGYDPMAPDLAQTPARWAQWWMDFATYDAGRTDTVFNGVRADQMVCVSGMRVWSLCEHHLLPFWCDVSIAYLADTHVIGLSKLGRIAQRYAHRLQVQERLCNDIANHVAGVVFPLRDVADADVAVIATGEHLCMTMRGVRTAARMTSSVVHGKFRDRAEVRGELLALHQASR